MSDLTAAADGVKYAARCLGFSDCRIAPASVVPGAGKFREWLKQGGHADMDWLARNPERRCDPRLVLNGCRSVIMLSYPYGNDWQDPLGHYIAQYAWGADYHSIIEEKLADLDETLAFYGGVQRCYVDTGPVLEREFAAMSGLGWTGKSGLVLNIREGSHFFLAGILTTLELPHDAPVASRCGSCTACIQSCPTGALGNDGLVDASKCISYLTIEHKGSIPVGLRPLIGTHIYGCDECRRYCPWERKPQVCYDSRFAPSSELRGMKLRDFLLLDDDGFTRLFRKSPVRRIKRERLLRNVAVVLGNAGGSEDVDALHSVLGTSVLVDEHVMWALEQIRQRG